MRLQAVDRPELDPALIDDPAFLPLVAQTLIDGGQVPTALGIDVPEAGRLRVDPSLADRPGRRVLFRYGLELAWLRGIPGLAPAAASLLAMAAAGRFLRLLPAREVRAAAADPAAAAFLALVEAGPTPAAVATVWRHAGAGRPPADDAVALVARVWRCAQPLEALLLDGGDERLALDATTGLNRYLCPPYPQPAQLAFSSCTASSIGPAAALAAERARQTLVTAALANGTGAALRAASRDVTDALLAHYGIAGVAEVVLAASGTDATLLLTGLLAAEHPGRAITTVLMSPAETGSGVPEAVQGRHFARCTAAGTLVTKGDAVDGFPPALAMTSVALRGADGLPRDAAVLEAETAAAIEAILARGEHPVLHAIDGSKTGLVAPDRAACERLAARFRGRLDIVIDACQARVEPAIVQRYLAQGFPVLVTGSKFFGAPGFCGAILFPRDRLTRIAAGGRLPDGLGDYAELTEDGVSRRCPGLLMRWAAALHEMRRFAALPAEAVRDAIDRASAATRAALMREPWVQLMAAPRPPGPVWSGRRSVFTFAVRGAQGDWLSAEALRPLYVDLSRQGVLLGQPVQLGSPMLGGLRIAFSAAQLADGGECRGAIGQVVAKLGALVG